MKTISMTHLALLTLAFRSLISAPTLAFRSMISTPTSEIKSTSNMLPILSGLVGLFVESNIFKVTGVNTTIEESPLAEEMQELNTDKLIQGQCDHVTGSERTELRKRINKLQSVSKMVKQYQVGLINHVQLLDSCEGLGMDGLWIWKDAISGKRPNVEVTC